MTVLPIKIPVLMSYAYMRNMNEKVIDNVFTNNNIKILLDCGAFTALNSGKEIKLDDYMQFIRKYEKYIYRYIALDVIGDVKKTEYNLKEMLRNGFKPMPVHIRGDSEKRMNELFEMSDYVAFGGLKRPRAGHCPKEYVKLKMKWAAGRKVHWLGYTKLDMLCTFTPTSCDSSNITGSLRFGSMAFYHDNNNKMTMYTYDDIIRKFPKNMEKLITWRGFDPSMLFDNEFWHHGSRTGLNLSWTISANSFIRYTLDLKKYLNIDYFLAVTEADILPLIKEISYAVSHPFIN